MPVRGDFSGLEELRRRLRGIADERFRLELSKNLGEEARTQAMYGFEHSVDPYDRAWTPLSSRVGKPLLDTGTHLRSSIAAHPTSSGFTLSTAFIGAAVHQYGAVIHAVRGRYLRFQVGGLRPRGHGRSRGNVVFAKRVRVPRRQFIPEGTLGPRWSKAFDDAGELVMRRQMGRA